MSGLSLAKLATMLCITSPSPPVNPFQYTSLVAPLPLSTTTGVLVGAGVGVGVVSAAQTGTMLATSKNVAIIASPVRNERRSNIFLLSFRIYDRNHSKCDLVCSWNRPHLLAQT